MGGVMIFQASAEKTWQGKKQDQANPLVVRLDALLVDKVIPRSLYEELLGRINAMDARKPEPRIAQDRKLYDAYVQKVEGQKEEFNSQMSKFITYLERVKGTDSKVTYPDDSRPRWSEPRDFMEIAPDRLTKSEAWSYHLPDVPGLVKPVSEFTSVLSSRTAVEVGFSSYSGAKTVFSFREEMGYSPAAFHSTDGSVGSQDSRFFAGTEINWGENVPGFNSFIGRIFFGVKVSWPLRVEVGYTAADAAAGKGSGEFGGHPYIKGEINAVPMRIPIEAYFKYHLMPLETTPEMGVKYVISDKSSVGLEYLAPGFFSPGAVRLTFGYHLLGTGKWQPAKATD